MAERGQRIAGARNPVRGWPTRLAIGLIGLLSAGGPIARAAEPVTASEYTARAFELARDGHLSRAKSDIAAALGLDPRNARALSLRGGIEIVENEPDKAVADLDLSIGTDPSYPNAYFDRARAHLMRAERAAALADYDAALKINPKFAAALANRGLLHVVQGEIAPARADFETALSLPPDDDRTRNAQQIARDGLASLEPGAP